MDQEVLYRYALQLGMDKQPVAERRLARIAAFVARNPHERKSAAERASEALDLGLHHGDLVVRRILIDGARRLIRAVVLVRQPSEEMLEAYLAANGASFITSAKTRITHVAGLFGLLHGLGFAGALGQVGLPEDEIPLALFSFNVGIELGQVAFVGLVLAVWALLSRLPFAWPRIVQLLPAYTIGSLAAFWFFARSWSSAL